MKVDEDLQLIYDMKKNHKKALALWMAVVFEKGRFFTDELTLQFMEERNRLYLFTSGVGDIPYYLLPDFMEFCYLFLPSKERTRIEKAFVKKGWS